MTSTITDIIAELVLQTDPELGLRLDEQTEALIETECTNRVVGRWIDENDAKYLRSSFALGDQDFANRFPALADVTAHQRSRLLATIETHFDECPHCSLKRGYDLEWDARIKQVCKQNSPALLQQLKEEQAAEYLDDQDSSPVSVPA